MKIAMFGASGFIGQNLQEFIKEWQPRWEILAPSHQEVDLSIYEDVENFLIVNKPDVIWFGAAKCAGIGGNMAEPYNFGYFNALYGMNLIDVCVGLNQLKEYRPKLFLNMGTICAHSSEPPTIPFIEREIFSGDVEPTNGPYAHAKRYIMVLGEAAAKTGIPFHTLMMANTYGKYDHFSDEKSHVIPALIKKIDRAKQDGTELRVWGTGEATRDFLYSEDAACGIVRAIEILSRGGNPLNNQRRINLGTGVETSIRELVNYLVLLMDFRGRIIWDNSKPEGQKRRVLNISLMKNHANWMPLISLPEGLRRTLEYYEKTNC